MGLGMGYGLRLGHGLGIALGHGHGLVHAIGQGHMLGRHALTNSQNPHLPTTQPSLTHHTLT